MGKFIQWEKSGKVQRNLSSQFLHDPSAHRTYHLKFVCPLGNHQVYYFHPDALFTCQFKRIKHRLQLTGVEILIYPVVKALEIYVRSIDQFRKLRERSLIYISRSDKDILQTGFTG